MDMQIEKLKQEIENQKEYEQMLEDQIKEHEELIDKQKANINSKDNEIKTLKKQLQDAIKKADVLNNTDDVSGAKIIQLEVEIHDLTQKVQESSLEIKQLNQKIIAKGQEQELEIEYLKEEFQQKDQEYLKQISELKKQIQKLELSKCSIEENLQKEIAALKSIDQTDLTQEIERLKQEIQVKTKQLEIQDQQIETLQLQGSTSKGMEADNANNSKDVHNLEEKIAQLEEVLLHYQEENSQFLQKEEKYQQGEKQFQEQLKELSNNIKQLEEEKNQLLNEGPANELEDLKLEYEELVQEYTSTNDKLQQSETECTQLTDKCQEYLAIKEELQDKISSLELLIQHHNEVVDENNELKLLISKAKEDLNNLESNNEYQTLFLQIRDEYEEFKESVTQTLREKEQQLYQAAQLIQEQDTLKEQSQMQEQNYQLLTKQLQTQLENNEAYQQQIEQLENELNVIRKASAEFTDIKMQLSQVKTDNENLKTENYAQSEIIKDYEIQIEALKQIECDSPRKISKLQQENTEATTEYVKLKETTSREIHLLKQEKLQYQSEINELKQMIDSYINSLEFETKTQYLADYWAKLQGIQDEQNNLVEKFQMEIQDLTENIGQIQSLKNLSTIQQNNEENERVENQEQFNSRQENILTQLEENTSGFHLNIKQVTQIEYSEKDTQTDATIYSDVECQSQMEIQLPQPVEVVSKYFENAEVQTDDKQLIVSEVIEEIVKQYQDYSQQTEEVVSFQIEESKQEILQISVKEVNEDEKDEEKIKNVQEEQDNPYPISGDEVIVKKLLGSQEADCNTSFDFATIESLKKKLEDLDTLRKTQEKEISGLKEKVKKQEEKIANIQKPITPRKQSDAKIEQKKQQDNELIARYQKQIKELSEEIEQFNAHELNDQIEQQANEIEQLSEELTQYQEQFIQQRKRALQYKFELEKIYNLGPAALQQLQTEVKKEQPQSQTQIMERYQVSLYLYLKSQRQYQCSYLEFNRKYYIHKSRSVKIFSSVKGKIEKSVFDTYLFDEIFYDTQKIHQFLEGQKVKLQNDNTRVSLILGQSKTHKKLIMIMLIEFLYNSIAKLEITQKITLSYQERIGKQWIEIEQFNIVASTISDLEYAIQNIKVHLLTKQKSSGEKIRKLTVIHQSFYQEQLSSTNQFIIVTCPSLPQGDFKTVVSKILNQQINQNFQFNIFLAIIPTLQQYRQSADILYMAKIAKQVRSSNSDYSSLTSSKSVSELITDDESQKQVRMANNKLILKQQEIEQQKKYIDISKRQLVELQVKHDNLQGFLTQVQSLVSSVILEIKGKINLKMNQKKNKKSGNVAFLDKLAIQLDATIRKSVPNQIIVDNNNERYRSRASEIINPFM